MTLTSEQLQQDYAETDPDVHFFADAWVTATKQFKGNAPAVDDLATAITGIGEDLTMQGAPQLQVDLIDDDWVLLDSGFFDADSNGIIDDVQVTYPQGSKYHWRLFQISPKADFTIQTYWIPRVVADLMKLRGPFSANRASRTRAEFLKMCADKVKYAHFHSKELTQKQPIKQPSLPTSGVPSNSAGPRNVGLPTSGLSGAGLTVQGKPMSPAQAALATTFLQVADQKAAGSVATQALIYAAVWENNMTNDWTPNRDGARGPLQGTDSYWASHHDPAEQAASFLDSGKGFGFQNMGAIGLSRSISNPIEIAVRVEDPSVWPANAYASNASYPGDTPAMDEVTKIIDAGGGATGAGGVSGGPTEVAQQYNFSIGTTQDPHEDYWTGMNRTAQEVNWELVVDGDDIYYDSDKTLCRSAIVAYIDRDDEAVNDWSYDWDMGMLVANFQVVLTCDPFQFRAADVFQVKGFGPASKGSTIKLPGRWLVGEIQRNPGDIVSTFTLVQPTRSLEEPAPTLASSGSSAGVPVLKGGATNPAPGAQWSRLDMGFDGNYGPDGAVAPFAGTIHGIGIGGWPGQGQYFVVVNDDQSGPDYTRAMYFAEGARPMFPNGTRVRAGQKVGTPVQSGGNGTPGNFEIGPANTSNYDTLAKDYGLGSSGARKMVEAFARWLESLGASKPTDTSSAGNV